MKRWERPRPCSCTGYWFPHRKGGGACEHSTSRRWHLALRNKVQDPEELLEAYIEMIWSCRARPVKSDVPPF